MSKNKQVLVSLKVLITTFARVKHMVFPTELPKSEILQSMFVFCFYKMNTPFLSAAMRCAVLRFNYPIGQPEHSEQLPPPIKLKKNSFHQFIRICVQN